MQDAARGLAISTKYLAPLLHFSVNWFLFLVSTRLPTGLVT